MRAAFHQHPALRRIKEPQDKADERALGIDIGCSLRPDDGEIDVVGINLLRGAEGLKPLASQGWEVITASLNDPDQGISESRLNSTDVLIWWGHKKHGDVNGNLVNKIAERLTAGKMEFIGTHSCHFAKPFKTIMGTRCSWREYVDDGTSAEIIVKLPDHPICKGVKNFKLPKIERYGEPFALPEPEAVPLDGIYTKPNGQTESARMGLCWTIGKGKVFYFTPGHETFNDYYLPEVRQIFVNAVPWAAPKA